MSGNLDCVLVRQFPSQVQLQCQVVESYEPDLSGKDVISPQVFFIWYCFCMRILSSKLDIRQNNPLDKITLKIQDYGIAPFSLFCRGGVSISYFCRLKAVTLWWPCFPSHLRAGAGENWGCEHHSSPPQLVNFRPSLKDASKILSVHKVSVRCAALPHVTPP